MSFKVKRLFACLCMACGLGCMAQTEKEAAETSATRAFDVERTTLFGIGRHSQLDEYLSPLTYGGMSLCVHHRSVRPMRRVGSRWYVVAHYYAEGAKVESASRYKTSWAGQFSADGGVRHTWTFSRLGLKVCAGGGAEVFGGGAFVSGNGNNPANGTLGVSLLAQGAVQKSFRLFRKPDWTAEVALSVPLVGCAFASQYGGSFYELSLGHRDRQIRFTQPFNSPSARLTATLSLPVLRHSRLMLGYLGDARQQRLNRLTRHAWNNAFVVGFQRRITFK